MTRVLVAGASGALGRCVLSELQHRGFYTRTLRVQECNLVGAADGMDVVFSCAGQAPGMYFSVRGRHSLDAELSCNLSLVAEAKRARVRRFVYVSALHAGLFPNCAYLTSHDRVSREIKRSHLEFGIVEHAGVFSQLDSLLTMARSGRAFLCGNGHAQSNPIDDRDLAGVCVQLIDGVGSMVVQAGGPEVCTRRQLLESAFASLGQPARIKQAPAWALRCAAFLSRPVAPRAADFLSYFQLLGSHHFIAPEFGTRRLSDYFKTIL